MRKMQIEGYSEMHMYKQALRLSSAKQTNNTQASGNLPITAAEFDAEVKY